ncbi:MAG: DUF480 domain-containing protein [Ilumatobacteraceae bacterium]
MLSIVEGRVLGCLLEKERTTPDQYPLTLNALVSACNQSTSRDPVMTVDPNDVDTAITSLKGQGLTRLVHPSHGRSVTRFRQVADEHFTWTTGQAALMAVLLLRGPQTIVELRTRSERQYAFESIDIVDATLLSLAAQDASPDGPVVVLLDRVVGQKELRWQQLIAEEAEHAPRTQSIAPAGGLTDRVAELEARVATLEAALADLL